MKVNLKMIKEKDMELIIIYHKGSKYEGEFKNNKNEGYGIYYYSNGDRYEGEFKIGKFEGYGLFYFLNGDRYEGVFKNEIINGYGKFYSSLGLKLEKKFKFDIYTKILLIIYKILLFLYHMREIFIKNKMTFFLIILLILGIIIN